MATIRTPRDFDLHPLEHPEVLALATEMGGRPYSCTVHGGHGFMVHVEVIVVRGRKTRFGWEVLGRDFVWLPLGDLVHDVDALERS